MKGFKVSLKEVADQMDISGAEAENYLDTRTGELHLVTPDTEAAYNAFSRGEGDKLPDWLQQEAAIVNEIRTTNFFIQLPTTYEIHEWNIMRDFVQSISNEKTKSKLTEAISGRGAFGRFRNIASRLGVLDDWYAWREKALIKIARKWCEENNVPYIKPPLYTKKQLEKEGHALTTKDGEKLFLMPANEEVKKEWAHFRKALYQEVEEEFLDYELDEILREKRIFAFLLWTKEFEAVAFLELSLRNIVDGCESSPVAYLEGIYIEENYRQKGLGKQLTNFIKKWGIQQGCSELATDSSLEDVKAQAFHKKMGFEETERIVQFRMDL